MPLFFFLISPGSTQPNPTDAGCPNNLPDKIKGKMETNATALASTSNNNPQPVVGSSIFWVILTLCITAAWHPVGAAPGFSTKLRRYARVFPLTCALDTALLYAECVSLALAKGGSSGLSLSSLREVRGAVRTVLTHRLGAGVPRREPGILPTARDGVGDSGDNGNNSNNDGAPDDDLLYALVLFLGLDIRARLASNVLVVFLYTKIGGYYGKYQLPLTLLHLGIIPVIFAPEEWK